MKNLRLTILALIVSITVTFAQNKEGVIETTKIEKGVLKVDNKTVNVKQEVVTKEKTPVTFDPNDKNKVNQDRIIQPTIVTKKIKSDYDKDSRYDNKVEIAYLKPEKFDLNVNLTKKGVLIKTDNPFIKVKKIKFISSYGNKIKKKIKKDGNYIVMLSSGESINLKVSNFKKIK